MQSRANRSGALDMLRKVTPGVLLLSGMPVIGSVWAANATVNPPADNANYSGLLIFLAIAYLSRRRAIGGWLLLYLVQLYLFLAAYLAAFVLSLAKLDPSAWNTSAHYLWFILSTIPVEVAGLAQAIAATLLLRNRTKANLERVRRVLCANILTGALSIWADYYQLHRPNDAAALAGVLIVWPSIWWAYWCRSVRVERVFVYRNWVYDGPARPERTPQEKRYRLKRALLGAAAIYLAGMMLFGLLVNGDKRPDPALLFYVPGFYAGVAFVVAWLVPIRKKKMEELLSTAVVKGQ